jgi:class 3 adenylate cyclase
VLFVDRLGSRLPFIGRREHLDLLEGSLRDVADGRPRIILVSGDAGVGKTRLLRELSPLARRHGVDACYGRWYEDVALPYLPFVESLRTLLAHAGGTVPGVSTDDAALVGRFLQGIAPTSPSADPVASAGSEQGTIRLFLALSRAVIAMVQLRPFALVLDDLHWADRSSLDLLSHLVFAVADTALREPVPLLILVAYRPVEAGQRLVSTVARFQREDMCVALQLSGFAESEIDQFIQGFGLRRPSHQLIATVAKATGGNPLFIQEVIHDLVARGALQERGGYLVTTMAPEDARVPPELTGAIVARLRGLSEECRGILSLASMLGDRFTVHTLAALGGRPEEELLDLLEEGMRQGALSVEGAGFEFSHPLIRHVLYTEPSEFRRKRMHLQIAQALECMYPESAEAHSLEIARHLGRAGPAADTERVAAWSRRAGDYAASVHAWAEAAQFYEAALAATEATGRLEAQRRAELHYLAGHARYRDLDTGPCLDHYMKATLGYRDAGDIRGLAQTLAEQTRARLVLATVPMGRLIDLEPLQESLEALGEREPGLRARIRAIMSSAYWTARQPGRAKEMAELALETGRALHDDALCAYASFVLAQAHFQRLEPAEALEIFQMALTYGRRSEDPWLQGWPLHRVPFLLVSLGRLDEAETGALQASKLARESHDWGNYALTQAVLGAVALARGNFRAANRYTSEAMLVAKRSHYAWGGVAALLVRACTQSLQGAWAEAESALDLLVEPGNVFDEPGAALRAIAGMFRDLIRARSARTGPPPAPGAVPRRLLAPEGPLDVFSLGSFCAAVELADLGAATIQVEEVAQALSEVSARGVVFSSEWPFLVPRIQGVVAALSGRLEQADAHFRAAIGTAERSGALPELGRSCLDYARALAARDPARGLDLARRASAIFGELGMEPFARQASALTAQLEAPPMAGRTKVRLAPLRAEPVAPAGTAPRGTAPLVIAVTDMTGSTELLQRLGDAEAQRLLHVHNDLTRACFRAHGGSELQHTGDGFLASFDSAAAAISCATAIQLAFATYSDTHPATPLRVRIGLHAGEALPEEGRLYGSAVHVTFRVCGRARPGEILASEAVRELVVGKGMVFIYRGRFGLKGFADRFRLYAVQWRSEGE